MNQPLAHAIRIYQQRGEQFADLIPWHTVNGIVVIDSDCLFLGYRCKVEKLHEVAAPGEADCLFVTYFGGDMGGLTRYGDGLKWIAFERLRARGNFKIHSMTRFIHHITS